MGAFFTISSIVYIIIFIFFFFEKNKTKTLETTIYKILLITTLVGLCLDTLGFFTYKGGISPDSFFYQSLTKGVLVYFFIWIGTFTYYIYAISYNHLEDKDYYNEKLMRFKRIIFPALTFLMIFAFLAPINFNIKNDVIFPEGIGVAMTYLTVGLCVLGCFIFTFRNVKHIVLKKYTPLFAMVILVILSAVVQIIFPQLFLVNFVIALIVVLLYFSIENPDIKIINELSYSQQLLKKSHESTNKSLNLLTEELAKPIELLYEFGNKEIDLKKEDKTIEEVKYLQKTSLKLVNQINGIIELTRLQNENSKLDKYDYNFHELMDELYNLLVANNEAVKLNFSVKDNVSKVLNGDALKIKQTVVNIYNYLITNHKIKNINLDISTTNAKVMARLKISFSFKKIDHYKLFNGDTTEEAIINRLIEMQSAKLEVRDEEEKTIVDFSLNQKRVLKYDITSGEETEKRVKYFDCSGKKVLIVDDNYEKINYLINLLKPYGLNVEIAHNYLEYEKKMYSGTNWDLILLDDMMPDSHKFAYLNFSETEKSEAVNNIEMLTNQKLPLVLMITPNTEMESLSGDYLIKPIKKDKLHEVITKYLK